MACLHLNIYRKWFGLCLPSSQTGSRYNREDKPSDEFITEEGVHKSGGLTRSLMAISACFDKEMEVRTRGINHR